MEKLFRCAGVGPNYLAVELIDVVLLQGPLPVPKAIEYADQILDALDAAHRKGMRHSDLKPWPAFWSRSRPCCRNDPGGAIHSSGWPVEDNGHFRA